ARQLEHCAAARLTEQIHTRPAPTRKGCAVQVSSLVDHQTGCWIVSIRSAEAVNRGGSLRRDESRCQNGEGERQGYRPSGARSAEGGLEQPSACHRCSPFDLENGTIVHPSRLLGTQ